MEFVFTPPPLLLWVSILLFLTTIVVLFFIQKHNAFKLTVLSAVVLLLGILLFAFYRETHLRLTASGLYADTYGEINLAWEEVEEAFVVPRLAFTVYDPVELVDGREGETGRFGWFRMQNNLLAQVALADGDACLVVKARRAYYLFAPEEFTPFVQAFQAYWQATRERQK